MSVSKAGGASSPLVTGGAIAAADASDLIVVTGMGNAADYGIVRVPLAGGAPVTLVTGVPIIASVAMDASRVYWGTNGSIGDCFPTGDGGCPTPVATIQSVSRAGGAVSTLASGHFDPVRVAVDDAYVYWPNASPGDTPAPDTSIARVPKSGGAATAVARLPDTYVSNMALDDVAAYWIQASLTDSAPPSIMRAPKDGGAPTRIVSLSGATAPRDLALDGASVYWIDISGAILRAPKAGGVAETLVPSGTKAGAGGSAGLLADGASVYWTTGVTCGQGCAGEVLRLVPACR